MASARRRERRRLQQMKALAEQVERDIAELSKDLRIDEQLAVVDGGAIAAEPVAVPDDYPLMVERHAVETAMHGQSYEEANWARLAPHFRDAHNRLRVARGMSPLPPPAIDLYRPPLVRKVDPKELEALTNDARGAAAEFLSGGKHGVGPRLMYPGREGFTINGDPVKF